MYLSQNWGIRSSMYPVVCSWGVSQPSRSLCLCLQSLPSSTFRHAELAHCLQRWLVHGKGGHQWGTVQWCNGNSCNYYCIPKCDWQRNIQQRTRLWGRIRMPRTKILGNYHTVWDVIIIQEYSAQMVYAHFINLDYRRFNLPKGQHRG